MKTTIEIRTELLRRARDLARAEDSTLRALVEEGLRRVVEERESGRRRKRRFRMATFRGNGLVPGVREGDWRAILDVAYEGRGT
jgi:hypothetical protein